MEDVIFGAFMGTLLSCGVAIGGMIIHSNGEEYTKDACTKFGKTEIRGKVWECNFKEIKP